MFLLLTSANAPILNVNLKNIYNVRYNMCKTCRFNRNVHSVYIVIAWELCYLQSIVVKSRCFR